MAGSTLNWSTVNIPRGVTYHLWAGLSVPAAGARLSLDTSTLTPDATANPNAIHLGRTSEGVTVRVATTTEGSTSDEFSAPYRVIPTVEEMVISATLKQVLDFNILQRLSPVMTRTTGSGYEEMSFGGTTTVATTSVALICAMPEDATKAFVAQLYRTSNDAPIEVNFRRTQDGMTAVSFRGQAVETRAAGDQIGKIWKQVAV